MTSFSAMLPYVGFGVRPPQGQLMLVDTGLKLDACFTHIYLATFLARDTVNDSGFLVLWHRVLQFTESILQLCDRPVGYSNVEWFQ